VSRPLRYVLFGDGESPHIAKWVAPRTELWLASSRGLHDSASALLPPERCLLLDRHSAPGGGNAGMLRALPQLTRWLRSIDPDWINPHYLTSHGLLAWLARGGWRTWPPGRPLHAHLLGSAWGSDILVTPHRNPAYRAVTQRVLSGCDLCTSDSQHMAERMRALGAREVMVFPFGLESMPAPPDAKERWLFFANRGLEPIYRPMEVLRLFWRIAEHQPKAQLVVANDGSQRDAMERWVAQRGLRERVRFVGRLSAEAQAVWYARAQWYLSLPQSDAVSVSVIEAMAHGCLPLLSDLPANRELVRPGETGLLQALDATDPPLAAMVDLLDRAAAVAGANRAWVAEHAMFGEAVDRLLARLAQIGGRR
jgi:L-malate glycosyltransferase